ncbi:acyl-CoA dehydrogenase family protein [Paraferrimonas sedimenticola]|uniref:Dibenzothiophene monooxygenase n=1 Tax=Paraferrimonas sedimenticola TaxID=375674 RepID=A0AA37RXC7_9GAMM|nr:acyl-CoA dehydrogenase family protein [Paraferrimonas sedimenticola]GLP96377.1 acyl-CoA dehydrogenase [Paraferrimonas sedimenticola]
MKYTGEHFVEDMSDAERDRAAIVDSVLPLIQEAAGDVDRSGEFHLPHVKTLSDAGLLGLIIPKEYGGMGGGLRDLAAATFALGSVCPSTALCYFFHCSSASRGLLALEALEAGLFNEEEAPLVQAFADKVLNTMGRKGEWLANFASETVKSEKAAITISTKAKKVEGGYLLNGVKSFGCATGVADQYLVTAALEGIEDASGLSTFFVKANAKGVSERQKWDAIGMRGSATHGLILEDVFIPEDDALTVPAAFTRCMQMSRGSFVGNQLAGIAVYLGQAWSIYNTTLTTLTNSKFGDSDKSIAHSPMHQQLIGEMMADLETAVLWLRRQLQLETAEPEILPKGDVVKRWRLCKGQVSEYGFKVAMNALKCTGTSGTGFTHPSARGLREMAMALVQAFPAERGRLMAASMEVDGAEQNQFGVGKS